MGFADWWIEYVNSLESRGVRVTPDTVMTYSSVWQAVNTIASDVACAPLVCHNIEADGDLMPDRGNPANYLFNVQPNDLMTGYTFRETLQAHALLYGNGMAAIERDSNFNIVRMVPLLPDRTEIHLVDGRMIYETKIYRDDNIEPESKFLGPLDVFHVPGLGFSGYRGYPAWRYGKESFGLGMELERNTSRTMKNASVPAVALKTDRNLSAEEADLLLANWEKKHGGENAGNTAIAAGGLEIVPLSHSARDSQSIENRKFQRVEVASWFMLPPHKLGDDSRLSYNSLEAEERAYLNQTLRRWFTRWESEANRKILSETQKRRGRKTFRHDVTKLVEGDMATMADVAQKLVGSEIATRNEMRRKFGLPMIDDPIANELRNPNTRTDDTADGEEPVEPQDTAPDTNQMLTAHVRMIEDRWTRTIETDIGKVRRAAKTSKNFVSWLDSHYETIQGKIDDSMELIVESMTCLAPNMTYTPGAAYASDSKELLLEVAGSCVNDLHSRVVEATEDWQNRITTYLPEFDQ